MDIVVKRNGEEIRVNALKSDVEKIIKKGKHLCGNCKALVCVADNKFASELVKVGIKTDDRYYIFDCEGYKAKEKYCRIDEDTKKYGSITYNIVHPTVRARFM